MSATVIISLDCEGKWGVADHLDASHDVIDSQRLHRAYERVFDILDTRKLPATFAVVEMFRKERAELEELAAEGRIGAALPYTRPAWDSIARNGDGWHAPWFDGMVTGRHELATHGATHTPWDQLQGDSLAMELDLMGPLDGRTMVFPRNKVAHLPSLRAAGLLGYRAERVSTPVRRLLSELNPRSRPDQHVNGPAPLAIPSGRFVNWKSGGRRFIPTSLSVRRARHLLRAAADEFGVVHFWTHPVNFVTAPETLDVFEGICDEIAGAVQDRKARVVTQRGYALERVVRAA